jgi:hypothetical protein
MVSTPARDQGRTGLIMLFLYTALVLEGEMAHWVVGGSRAANRQR